MRAWTCVSSAATASTNSAKSIDRSDGAKGRTICRRVGGQNMECAEISEHAALLLPKAGEVFNLGRSDGQTARWCGASPSRYQLRFIVGPSPAPSAALSLGRTA